MESHWVCGSASRPSTLNLNANTNCQKDAAKSGTVDSIQRSVLKAPCATHSVLPATILVSGKSSLSQFFPPRSRWSGLVRQIKTLAISNYSRPCRRVLARRPPLIAPRSTSAPYRISGGRMPATTPCPLPRDSLGLSVLQPHRQLHFERGPFSDK
jgi:hypothetical protein